MDRIAAFEFREFWNDISRARGHLNEAKVGEVRKTAIAPPPDQSELSLLRRSRVRVFAPRGSVVERAEELVPRPFRRAATALEKAVTHLVVEGAEPEGVLVLRQQKLKAGTDRGRRQRVVLQVVEEV